MLLLYDIVMFVTAALSKSGHSAFESYSGWFQCLIWSAPVLSMITFCTVSMQTLQHIGKINDDSAVQRHDRAVQIILLPLVYGTTSFTALTRLYRVTLQEDVPKEYYEDQLYKAETTVMVGDLYEAWALYQFGQLTLELIESSIAKQGLSEREEERAAARALMVAHTAVESLAWVGVLSFVIICVMESGATVYIMTFVPTDEQIESYEMACTQFTTAGFLASCVAIYNVFVVETTFHHFLDAYSPWLKFLTVKFLVSFAYFQAVFFDCCRYALTIAPGLQYIPVLGEVLKFEEVTFEVFYNCLMALECFFVAMMHLWAWRHNEEWYDEVHYDRTKLEDESRETLGH